MINLQLLQFETLIIHRVPRKSTAGSGPAAPTLSDAPTPDRDDVKVFFQRRVRAAVSDFGLDIEPNPGADQAGNDAVRAMLADPQTLTAQSRLLAQRLFDVQDMRNTPGLLVVGVARLGQRRAVALMKLEHNSGIRAEERRINGQLTFEVVVHDDLLLTPHTQLFKGAVFALTGDEVEAVGADLQVAGIADFFLHDFLGFRLVDTPAVTTERFLDVAERWLRGVPDAERQARYEIAILAQLHSAQSRVSVPAFAEANLDLDDRQSFRTAVTEGGVRWGAFHKDTSGIENRIKRVAFSFGSGIKLVGRREAVEEHVNVEQLEGSRARVTVEDEFSSVHTHG